MIEVELLRRTFGEAGLAEGEFAELAEALTRFPPPSVRLRPDVSAAASAWLPQGRVVPWHPRGRTFEGNVRPARSVFFAAGEWYVQDAGSLLADALVDVAPGQSALDLCASPGGKSTALAERLGPAGLLVANEPVAGRLDALKFNLARHGYDRYVVTSLDPTELAKRHPGRFDVVLVDAPCSGQSLVVRGKQAASAFGSAAVGLNAERQSRILDAAGKLVRPGGSLVYATCTFAREENEDQIARIVREHSDWSIEPEERLAGFESPLLAGSYRLLPHRHPTAGAFAARLRRAGEAGADTPTAGRATSAKRSRKGERPRRQGRSGTGASETTLPAEIERFADLGDVRTLTRGQSVFAFPADFPTDFDDSLVGGPEALFVKGKTYFPSYALAMRRGDATRPRAALDVSVEDAARYLRGESFEADATGWAVVRYAGLALGWCKADGRLAKNHLPKPGRIDVD